VYSLFCIVSPFCAIIFLILYKSTEHCHRVETQLQSINVISYQYLFFLNAHRLHVIQNVRYVRLCSDRSLLFKYILKNTVSLLFKQRSTFVIFNI